MKARQSVAWSWFLAITTGGWLAAAGATATEALWVQLGPTNEEHGLSVSSAGDGANVAETLAGSTCRRIAGPKALYLYLKADEKRVAPGAHDAWLAVEYFDDRLGIARVVYDKAPVVRAQNSCYTIADDVILLTNLGRWQRAVVHLPELRFGHGQNFQADARLVGEGLAVRRLELMLSCPSDYHPDGFDAERLQGMRPHIGQGMELDIGCDATAAEAALFRAVGATSVESYVTWQSVEDAGEGQWDWSRWDAQVAALRKAGLKWAPLLLAGPAYATPKWYRESDQSVPYVCLEHGQESKIQSLWNPKLRPWIERFVKAFAGRYGGRGVIELVRLGATGTYGETLYPSGPPTGWTYNIPGLFHNHIGWWAGDRFAVRSFREYLIRRYADVAALNRAWGAQYASFDAITPMLPDRAPSLRARLDQSRWYVDSMTDFAGFWVATVRKHFPDTPLYLTPGGSGRVELGADFGAQAKICVPHQARLRITNEGSDYARNFAHTREVVSACRAYGIEYGLEPAGKVSADGNVARIYNATASGAIHFFCYKGNLFQDSASASRFGQYLEFLQRRSPRTHAAVYLPKTSWLLDSSWVTRVLDDVQRLRDRVDCELLDHATLATPLGGRMKVLAISDAPYAEPEELEALQRWVAAGGILIARASADRPLLSTPEGSFAARDALLVVPAPLRPLSRPVLKGPAPRRFQLALGTAGDEPYLCGDWHSGERGALFDKSPDARMRWTGAKARVHVPCNPAVDAALVLVADLTRSSLPGTNTVSVNGQVVGQLDRAGVRTYRFPVSKALLADECIAEVTLDIRTFLPTEHGTRDARRLGAAVHRIELCSQGAENEPARTTPLACEIDWAKVQPCIRRIGLGATLTVAAQPLDEFDQAVVEALLHPEHLIPGARGVMLPSPDIDGIHATELSDGVLYYNETAQPRMINGIEVPAKGIAWQKRQL